MQQMSLAFLIMPKGLKSNGGGMDEPWQMETEIVANSLRCFDLKLVKQAYMPVVQADSVGQIHSVWFLGKRGMDLFNRITKIYYLWF